MRRVDAPAQSSPRLRVRSSAHRLLRLLTAHNFIQANEVILWCWAVVDDFDIPSISHADATHSAWAQWLSVLRTDAVASVHRFARRSRDSVPNVCSAHNSTTLKGEVL